jgi:hypothetical protein
MDITPDAAAVPAGAERARLTGVISRILNVGGSAWAEIAIDGAPNLFREIRVPYPIQNEDGSVSRFESETAWSSSSMRCNLRVLDGKSPSRLRERRRAAYALSYS